MFQQMEILFFPVYVLFLNFAFQCSYTAKVRCLFICIKSKVSANRHKTLNLEEVFKSMTKTTIRPMKNTKVAIFVSKLIIIYN